MAIKHVAIYGSDIALSSPLLQSILGGACQAYFPELMGLKGALFSNTTLAKFVNEEVLHDVYDLTSSKRSIRTFSSGEQKKALLKYLLDGHADFLMVDNPFDALDLESVAELKKRLVDLSKEMPIIQVFKRYDDLLPFITHGMRIEHDEIVHSSTISEYLSIYSKPDGYHLKGTIPPPMLTYPITHDELVSFRNVSISYQEKRVLHQINWQIKKGEFWQLKGPNGSGKSTLLTMINGDNPKAYGEAVYIFGKRKGTGENVWQIKEQIGYFTPSMMDLFKGRFTAEQMLVSGLLDSIGVYVKPTDVQMHLAHQWLHLIGLFEKRKVLFFNLSQVDRRMVLMARAMIKHPPLLILDEPSNGLDDYSASMLSELINKMAEESTTSILYVSHRHEKDLKPDHIFTLIPSDEGSKGFQNTL